MWVCRLPVHIGPLGSYEFAEDSRKIGANCRVDVGIDPYEQAGKRIRIRQRVPLKRLSSAGRSRGTPLPAAFNRDIIIQKPGRLQRSPPGFCSAISKTYRL